MTRAAIALLHGEIQNAFDYNANILIVTVMAISLNIFTIWDIVMEGSTLINFTAKINSFLQKNILLTFSTVIYMLLNNYI